MHTPSEEHVLKILRGELVEIIEKEERCKNKHNIVMQKEIKLNSTIRCTASKYSRLGFTYSEEGQVKLELKTETDNNEKYTYHALSFYVVLSKGERYLKLKFTPHENNCTIRYSLDMEVNNSENDSTTVGWLTYEDDESSDTWFLNYTFNQNKTIKSGGLNEEKVESLLADMFYRIN